jgi:hypothetical protein
MRARRLRRLTAVVALVCAALEPAPGITLFVSAFDQRSDHAHSLRVVSDVGHVDVVLSHAAESRELPADAGPELAADPSQRDHVYHITTSDLSTATSYRAAPALHAAPAFATAFVSASPRRALSRSLRGAHVLDPLSTIVLRI